MENGLKPGNRIVRQSAGLAGLRHDEIVGSGEETLIEARQFIENHSVEACRAQVPRC